MTRSTGGDDDEIQRLAYTADQFSRATGVPYSTVTRNIRSGDFPHVRVGRLKLIPAWFADQMFEERKATG